MRHNKTKDSAHGWELIVEDNAKDCIRVLAREVRDENLKVVVGGDEPVRDVEE